MRTTERLRGLKKWTYENFCKGREMKAPPPNLDLTKIVRKEMAAISAGLLLV